MGHSREYLAAYAAKANEEVDGFLVRLEERMPFNQIWLVNRNGQLLGKCTVPSWNETGELADMIVEAMMFTNSKKREPTKQIWCHPNFEDQLRDALNVFAEEDNSEVPLDDGITQSSEPEL